jgi:hypothetical protein
LRPVQSGRGAILVHHRENMQYAKGFLIVLWSLLNVAAAGYIAFYTFALLAMSYDEMHTLTTAMDPDPSLTQETVLHNIRTQSALTMLSISPFVAIFFGANYALWMEGRPATLRNRRLGLWLPCLCCCLLIFAILAADYHCYRTYPQR